MPEKKTKPTKKKTTRRPRLSNTNIRLLIIAATHSRHLNQSDKKQLLAVLKTMKD